ncbi:MAG TPA: sugar phosphate isomerase/epimerase [Rhizobium sp.]
MTKSISIGCHGSTWDLDYDHESDRLDNVLDTIAACGFEGIDAQIALLGRYRLQPERLKEELDRRGLRLAALTVPFTWPRTVEIEDERALADYFIGFLKHFPEALLNIPARNGPDRSNLLPRQRAIINCANAIARRSADHGVVASFHPASPPTSYFRTEDDYRIMFDLIDPVYLGWTPDLGHIARGGMDAVAMVKAYRSFVKHVHIKDYGGRPEAGWRKMGTGDVDFVEMTGFLQSSGYDGWIMVEEETEQSAADPDAAVKDIGEYVSRRLRPAAIGRA